MKVENQGLYNITYVAGYLYVKEGDCEHDDDRKGNKEDHKSAFSTTAKSTNIKSNDKAGVFDKSLNSSTVRESYLLNQAEVYPNPTFGKVTIQLNSINLSEKNITVTDIIGKVYSSKVVTGIYNNRMELDISSLKRGVYFIKVKIDSAFKTFKILKL